jgi:hypothetical protein
MASTDEKITVTNAKLFYRKKGTHCFHCKSTKESLWVVGNAIYLMCEGCQQVKGKEPFKENG